MYESLKKSGELSPAQLAYFDREDGAELLYEMRLLSTNRPATAAYIVDNELDPTVRTFIYLENPQMCDESCSSWTAYQCFNK